MATSLNGDVEAGKGSDERAPLLGVSSGAAAGAATASRLAAKRVLWTNALLVVALDAAVATALFFSAASVDDGTGLRYLDRAIRVREWDGVGLRVGSRVGWG